MVFYWNLSDSKSPEVSNIYLSLLADLNNTVIWMMFTCYSKSSSRCNNFLATVTSFHTSVLLESWVTAISSTSGLKWHLSLDRLRVQMNPKSRCWKNSNMYGICMLDIWNIWKHIWTDIRHLQCRHLESHLDRHLDWNGIKMLVRYTYRCKVQIIQIGQITDVLSVNISIKNSR